MINNPSQLHLAKTVAMLTSKQYSNITANYKKLNYDVTHDNHFNFSHVTYSYNKRRNLVEENIYDASGNIIEKDFYLGKYLAQQDLYNTSGNIAQSLFYSRGNYTGAITFLYNENNVLTEKDFTNFVGTIVEKDLFTDGVLAKKDFFVNNVLKESALYNADGSIFEKDYYKAGVIAEKDFMTGREITERDLYDSSGAIVSKSYYTNRKLTEIDFYTDGAITEKDFYTKNKLTEKDYLVDGVVTEQDFYSHGVVTRKVFPGGEVPPNPTIPGDSGVVTTDPYGNKVIDYGQAKTWGSYLDYSQGDNSKNYNFDCGLVACENVLIELGIFAKRDASNIVNGVDLEESAVVDYAAANGLCDTSFANPYYNGGTYGSWQQKILEHFGVVASDIYATLTDIATAIKNNFKVIAEVDAYRLWGTGTAGVANHSVAVTGVDYSYSNPNQIVGFYICDSGRGLKSDASRYVSYDLMSAAFNLNSNKTQGEAIITGASSGSLGVASVSSTTIKTVQGEAVELNSLIQQMASFSAGADLNVTGMENNANVNAIALVMGQTA